MAVQGDGERGSILRYAEEEWGVFLSK